MDATEQQNIFLEFGEAEVRCEAIWPLFMCISSYSMPSELADLIAGDNDACKALGLSDEEIATIDEFNCEREVISDILQERGSLGFLAQYATPIPFNFRVINDAVSSYTSGWGYVTTTWLYSEDLSDLNQKAIEWAKSEFNERKAKGLEDEKS